MQMTEMKFEARRALQADLDVLMRIVHEAQSAIAALGIDQWQDGYPDRDLILRDIAMGMGVVFTANGEIAGYMLPQSAPERVYEAIDGAWQCECAYLTIHRMMIGDGYRGTGLSHFMLDWAQRFAKAAQLGSVRADTHRGNVRMRRLLEGRGYQACGLVSYDCDGDPLRVAYELEIAACGSFI